MIFPILTTKLYIPIPRSKVVLRPRLIEWLNEGLHRKLTLVSAPAGFGKTTVVSEWISECHCLTAWLSLDESDNDPTRFLTYLVAALQTIVPTIGDNLLAALQSPQPPPREIILTALLNEITAFAHTFILVLDDYHLTDAKRVDDSLAFLLEHLPSQMHLVITTREDPNLPLARLRVRNQLTELRAADLRFTPTEAAEFLSQVMGLSLTAEDIATLERRTEGWIAGLQLAALSMQGRKDIAPFVRAFAGNNRYIVDYLVDEVLQRQPEHVRNFLLQTAILDQLTGSLCNAVTGQQESRERLETLERGNFFVVPLDDSRHWYRYHHLFADVLYAHLKAEQPNQIASLHRRASEWYQQHGSPVDAIRHGLAAQDFARAAGLIELTIPAMLQIRQESTVLEWLQALPDELLRYRPILSAHYAGVLLQNGKLEGVEARLLDAERWLDTTSEIGMQSITPPPEMVVMNEQEFRHLPASIALSRAGQALVLGNLLDTVTYARRVLDITSENDYLTRGGAAALLGLAYWMSGNLESAYQSYADGMIRLHKAGNISDTIGGTIALADIRITQGRLREAMSLYEHGLQLATDHDNPVMRGTADMYVGMSDLYREFGDLYTATQHLERSKEQDEHTGFPQNSYRWRVAMARIRQAEGDLNGALALLHEAESQYVSDFYPNVRPIAALKTRVWIAQGQVDKALNWVKEQHLSADDDLSYLHEFEHITLAKVLLAQYEFNRVEGSLLEAMGLLDRLLQAAQTGQRMGNAIQILILQSLSYHMRNDIPTALAALQQALTLAEPEGYMRVFVDEGQPMAILLEMAAEQNIVPNYAHQLLKMLSKPEDKPPISQALIEPLSGRELEVLRLLGTDLDGPEIASQLMVSLNTLRTHTKNIYTKLGVNNRRSAIRRAEEIGLL